MNRSACKQCLEPIIYPRRKTFCSTVCKREFHNSYYQSYSRQKERGLTRKIEFIAAKGGGCQQCGYSRNYAALIFHHRKPSEKSFTLDQRNMANRSLEICLAELRKCDLLCANCHYEIENPKLMVDHK